MDSFASPVPRWHVEVWNELCFGLDEIQTLRGVPVLVFKGKIPSEGMRGEFIGLERETIITATEEFQEAVCLCI